MRLGLIMATAVATLAIVTIGVQASPLLGGNGIASKIDNPVTKVLVAICESSPTESYCQSLGKGDSLFSRSQQLDTFWKSKNINHTFTASEGYHNFINWRLYLGEMAPTLFK